jgi:2'-5' RNA ligase
MRTAFTLWLMPVAPLKDELREVIRCLAEAYDAPLFEPHVTLYAGPSNREEMGAIVKSAAQHFGSIELTLEKLGHTTQYTKTLFIQFAASADLSGMFGDVKKGTAQPSDYVLNPHLSLLYKRMDAAEQARLCRTVEIPKGSYRFDMLRAVEYESPLDEAAKIERITTVCEMKLCD